MPAKGSGMGRAGDHPRKHAKCTFPKPRAKTLPRKKLRKTMWSMSSPDVVGRDRGNMSSTGGMFLWWQEMFGEPTTTQVPPLVVFLFSLPVCATY